MTADATADARPTVAKRNHWKDTPDVVGPVEQWARLSVSVVIPAYRAQHTIEPVLAALARQTYPSDLLEVVVVDDSGDPPLELPEVVPARCRLVRSADGGWGRAHACATGVAESTGDIVLFLDADMVAFPDHVEAQLRLHHRVRDAVVVGHKRFVADWESLGRERLLDAIASGTVDALVPDDVATEHWVVERIAASDDLDDAQHQVFGLFTGATGSMPRRLYDACGGMDVELRLGEDTELGYRLAQVGGVFVPELTSSAWHLGAPTVETAGERSRAFNAPYFAQRVPLLRALREEAPQRIWRVPLLVVCIDARDADAAQVKACVDAVLASQAFDLRVELVAPWGSLSDGRRPLFDEPVAGWHALRAWYADEPRVELVEEPTRDPFPAPFVIQLPTNVMVGPRSLGRTMGSANKSRAGRMHVLVPGLEPGAGPTLTRTAALHRAASLGDADTVDLADVSDEAIDQVWGVRWFDGEHIGYDSSEA